MYSEWNPDNDCWASYTRIGEERSLPLWDAYAWEREDWNMKPKSLQELSMMQILKSIHKPTEYSLKPDENIMPHADDDDYVLTVLSLSLDKDIQCICELRILPQSIKETLEEFRSSDNVVSYFNREDFDKIRDAQIYYISELGTYKLRFDSNCVIDYEGYATCQHSWSIRKLTDI